MRVFHSDNPVIKRERLPLWEHVKVGGARRLVPFEKEIVWVRDACARLKLQHRGVELDCLRTMCDVYGYLTCVQAAIDEVPRFLAEFKIESGDQLTIAIELEVRDLPLLVDDTPDGRAHNANYKRKQYLAPEPGQWYTSDQPDEERFYPILVCLYVVKDELVWDSQRGYFGRKRVEALSDEVSHLLPKE